MSDLDHTHAHTLTPICWLLFKPFAKVRATIYAAVLDSFPLCEKTPAQAERITGSRKNVPGGLWPETSSPWALIFPTGGDGTALTRGST